jgi:FtsZ-binding cell division protein ZapB
MDAFAALEKKVEQLIGAYRTLQARVVELEDENRTLRTSAGGAGTELKERVDRLEAEREALRERLAKLLGAVDSIEL